MSITGSCGHNVDGQGPEGMGHNIAVEDYDRKGRPAVLYITVCDKCLAWYREQGIILTNPPQRP